MFGYQRLRVPSVAIFSGEAGKSVADRRLIWRAASLVASSRGPFPFCCLKLCIFPYAIWRTEVAEAVEDYVVVIKLGGTRHVRSVAIHHIGTGVYSCMGKLHHIPSVFSKSRFRGIGNVAVFGTFAAAVEADYDNVRVLLEV